MPDTSTQIELFGTFALAPTDTRAEILFMGQDNAVAPGDATARLMPPPLTGIVREVTLRTITLDDAGVPAFIDYFVELYGCRITLGAVGSPAKASRAAFYIGRTLAPIIPAVAQVNPPDTSFDAPDLQQTVEWPYILQFPTTPATGTPPGVPGLRALLTCTAIPADWVVIIGIGLLIESRMPGYPTAPLIQRGGVGGDGTAWPRQN